MALHYTTTTTTTTIATTTLHYTNCTAPQLQLQLQLQLHYTNYTTLQLQLRYNTTLRLQVQLQQQLHYTTLHPAVVVRWPLQPLQPLQETQRQPPFGPSVDSLCIRDSQQPTSPIGFLFLKLPPPPCALLLAFYIHFKIEYSYNLAIIDGNG